MRIVHGRVDLELHSLTQAEGTPLLLLHELYGSSADWSSAEIRWQGPVHALDFSGHGRSGRLRGGAYMPEMLLADADTALAHLGSAVLAGRGLGAYIALLLAGARRDDVPAALLMGGRGLAGGGEEPGFGSDVFARYLAPARESPPGADRRVHVLEVDVRPRDYAERFARAARKLLLVEDGNALPPWWEAVRAVPHAAIIPAGEDPFGHLQRTVAG